MDPMSRSTLHKLLLVDDDAAVRNMMALTLEHKGFNVVSAANVTEALKHIATESFDVLLTDLHMPNPGDGFTVVTAMRHSQPDALTLLVSGYPDVQSAMAAILLEADEVIVKPFDVGKLADHGHVEFAAPLVAGNGEGAEGRAVIALLAAEDLVALRLRDFYLILACQLERRLDRFRTAAGEVDCATCKVLASECQQFMCVFFRNGRCELAGMDKFEFGRLIGYGGGNLGHTVPDEIHRSRACQVEIFLPGAIPDKHAFTAHRRREFFAE
mgnify:CR=1 FL=1